MIRSIITLATLCFVGCAETSPIQPAATSKSHFAGAVYKGEFVTTGSGTPGADAYRVFVQGATGFVSIQSVRNDAEQRAKEFCGRKKQTMESLVETTAKPPYILGNFPRVEIVFDCVAVPDAQPAFAGDDSRYMKLMNLKKLLDGGIITQDEFNQEKAKILAQPALHPPQAAK
ncbi:MAG TPA: SHOCT domain-containing protein [Steroidobacteraceae bacterium]|nr:SHOCT domain-containing protein [Steroidobacteraceae bacterium]